MSYDAVVVGVGLAGLTAGLRLAERGRRVLLLAKGVGATHLSGGTIDVLGYSPALVHSPASALEQFVRDHPDHPYRLLSQNEIAASIEWLKGQFAPYRYVGGLERNFMLPTALGVPKPAAVVPETMAEGDLRAGMRFAIVGFRPLKDFYPAYAAGNLERSQWDVAARAIDIDPLFGKEKDVTPVALAQLFDDVEFRKSVIAELEPRLDAGEVVGFPAVLGMSDPHTVWQELQDGLGRPVFEVPTLPPSVPGMRLFANLNAALRRAGGRVIVGAEVVGAETAGTRVAGVRARTAARTTTYHADAVVLASGGFASGGIELDSHWRTNEKVFGLPVWGAPPPGDERFSPGYLDHHPMARAGVAVDSDLHPVDADGKRVYDNVFVAGATLSGAEPWREKSGDGISLSSGFRAASLILERGA